MFSENKNLKTLSSGPLNFLHPRGEPPIILIMSNDAQRKANICKSVSIYELGYGAPVIPYPRFSVL